MTATIRAIGSGDNGGGAIEPSRPRVEHPAALIGGAGVLGYLFGRRHHPIVWLALTGACVGAGYVVVVLWPFALAALVIVTAARARGHAWSLARYVATFGAWLGAVVLVIIGAAVLSAGGALIAIAGSWALWHAAVRPRVHQFDGAHPRAP